MVSSVCEAKSSVAGYLSQTLVVINDSQSRSVCHLNVNKTRFNDIKDTVSSGSEDCLKSAVFLMTTRG